MMNTLKIICEVKEDVRTLEKTPEHNGDSMNETIIKDEQELLKALDKGIDDMEAGRLTPHEESMKILRQRFRDYVLQKEGNR